MNNSLSLGKLIPVSLVLFSSFFGAGNLLFPPLFGYLAGSNLNIATLGFCITGVSLPILGVLAIAMTGGTDLTEVAAPVNIAYAKIIMFLSSMAIGPLFAIPRTAAFSYEIGIKPLLGTTEAWQLALYSALYFAFSFYVANNPSKVLNWLGKILTPALLVCLAVLFVKVLLAPSFVPGAPQDAYLNTPFLKGFQEGYNTMDLLASFLFGAATLTSIKTLGIEGKKNLIRTCLCAGLIAAGLLAVIYYFLGYAGAEAHRYLSGEFSNGAGILVATAHEYLGAGGTAILSAIIILACLTTSIGLIAAIADYFHILFNQKLSKKTMGFPALQLRAGYDHQDGDSCSVFLISGYDCPGLVECVWLRWQQACVPLYDVDRYVVCCCGRAEGSIYPGSYGKHPGIGAAVYGRIRLVHCGGDRRCSGRDLG